jgi:hypothetical protein
VRLRRHRRAHPLDTLLGDPGTIDAAVGALAATGGSDRRPYAVAVGRNAVMVHLAAPVVTEPPHPWRATRDPRLWVADRAGIQPPSDAAACPVAVGYSGEAVVFVDAARAPGPIVVTGAPDTAGAICETLAAQLPDGAVTDREVDGPHWPLIVQDGALYLVGLPVALPFSYRHALQVVSLVQAAARTARDRVAEATPEETAPAEAVPPEAVPPDEGDVDVETWIRHVKEAAETALARTAGSRWRSRPEPPTPPATGDPDEWTGTAVSGARDR